MNDENFSRTLADLAAELIAKTARRPDAGLGVLARGLGQFRVRSEHEHRLALERESRRRG